MARGAGPAARGTADGPSRSSPAPSRHARAPPWTICRTAGTPSAWIARASRESPGICASSQTPSVNGRSFASGATAAASTTTRATPPRARRAYHASWAALGASPTASPVTIGAITRRFARRSPFTSNGSAILGTTDPPEPSRRRVRLAPVNVLDLAQHLVGQHQLGAREIALELLQAGCADDR